MEWMQKLFKYGWIVAVIGVLASIGMWIFFIWIIIKLLQFMGAI